MHEQHARKDRFLDMLDSFFNKIVASLQKLTRVCLCVQLTKIKEIAKSALPFCYV